MLKIIDNIFSLNTSKKTQELEVDTKFVYNYYEDKETSIDDDIITVSDFSYQKKRFIRLVFKNLNESDKSDYNRDNFVESIYNMSLKTLTAQDILMFNKIDSIIPKRKFITNTLDDKEKIKISNFFKEDKSSIFSNNIKYNQKISYLNPEIFNNNLNRLNIMSDFPENGMLLNDSKYNELIFKGKQGPKIEDPTENLELNRNGCNFVNLKVLEKTVNEIESYETDFSNYNAIRCGLLIEKFILDGEKYKFLCGKFITKNKDSQSMIINNSIEDESVRYGQTYKYVVHNVYLYSEIDSIDKCVVNKYLICDHPIITSDISCFEEEAPPPPVNLKFMITGDNSIEIRWNEPTDYQYDAKGYQILKRHSLEESFTVIAQLEGHNESDLYNPEESVLDELVVKTPGEVKYSFIDNDYQRGKITIYAIRTIDAHGYFSDYSEQVAIVFDPFKEKLIYDLVSYSGAKRNTPNEKLLNKSIFFDYDDKIIDNLPIVKNIKSIKLYVTPDYCKVKTGVDSYHNIFNNDEEYKLTIFRLNDLEKYEKQFKITNFI